MGRMSGGLMFGLLMFYILYGFLLSDVPHPCMGDGRRSPPQGGGTLWRVRWISKYIYISGVYASYLNLYSSSLHPRVL